MRCLLLTAFLMTFHFFSGDGFAHDLAVSGMVSGRISENKDTIIINGATFILNGADNPAVRFSGDVAKSVVISNAKIISNNLTLRDNSGIAGVVSIDNSHSRSKVTLRDVHVFARNSDISSVSSAKSVCAGIVCNKAGSHDSAQHLYVTAIGKSNIMATQSQNVGSRGVYQRVP